eukprot:scaffold90234_cov69-Phaeocystis_antarctica.AAC.3
MRRGCAGGLRRPPPPTPRTGGARGCRARARVDRESRAMRAGLTSRRARPRSPPRTAACPAVGSRPPTRS